MLHFKSWKGSAQNHRALTATIGAFMLLSGALFGCQRNRAQEVAKLYAAQLFALSTQKANQCLEQILSQQTSYNTQADHVAADYYRQHGTWLWTSDPERIELSYQMLSYLNEQVTDIGFNPKAFFIKQIAADLACIDSLRTDTTQILYEAMARAELNLSRAYLRYARGQRYGFVNPTSVFNKLDLRDNQPGNYKKVFDIPLEQPDSTFFAEALRMVEEGHGINYLQSIEPKDTIYNQLKEAWEKDSTEEGRTRLLCNMERRRWRDTQRVDPDDGRYIFVNIPAQQLWAVRPDSVFSMRICCGAWKTKTPLLSSAITRIELNPEWNIPSSIVRDEVSYHAGDSAYFARNRYFIIDRASGDTINPQDLTPQQLRTGKYRVAQHSGRGNSLGRIIFRFPNEFAVYLHDTNNPSAFKRDRRTISHGCVRVERPFDVLTFLLPEADEWTLDRIRLSIDMKPQGKKGKDYLKKRAMDGATEPIRLINQTSVKPSVPVYLSYYTAYPNPETGKIETWRDRYEYDQHIVKAISTYLE